MNITGIEKAQQVRAEKSLGRLVNYHGRIMTKHQLVEKAFNKGATAKIESVEDKNAIQRLRKEWLILAGNTRIPDNAVRMGKLEEQIDKGIMKTEYHLILPDETYLIVSKAEYDYFSMLKQKQDLEV